ncbi:hypothetical protein ACFQ9Z_13795 [Streptomyces sp. NPDC056580]|uniref:hypothetical protein n=1 Tax=Streptomyces sp. NPDC056580 TaxID=3345872 RepID=UPI0036A88359
MADTNGWDRGRLLVLWGVAVLLAIGGAGIFLTIHDTRGDLAALEDSGKAFLQALGSGNGEATCALMTRTAQSELAAAQHKDMCPQAVEALVGPLSGAERGKLADAYASRFFARDSSLGHINLDDNPLQISELLLSKVDGKWLVTEWR